MLETEIRAVNTIARIASGRMYRPLPSGPSALAIRIEPTNPSPYVGYTQGDKVHPLRVERSRVAINSASSYTSARLSARCRSPKSPIGHLSLTLPCLGLLR